MLIGRSMQDRTAEASFLSLAVRRRAVGLLACLTSIASVRCFGGHVVVTPSAYNVRGRVAGHRNRKRKCKSSS